jgi:hypothetical protein
LLPARPRHLFMRFSLVTLTRLNVQCRGNRVCKPRMCRLRNLSSRLRSR